MNDITKRFGTLFHPFAGLIFHKTAGYNPEFHVQSYGIDDNGFLINGHPLTEAEEKNLSSILSSAQKETFLQSIGLLPNNVRYIDSSAEGFAIWTTPAQRVELLFTEKLGIPNGLAAIPPLLWKASKTTLRMFALTTTEINEDSQLYLSPFLNTDLKGEVCMGTVRINIPNGCTLELFLKKWQDAFFNSAFSHANLAFSPIHANLAALWTELINSRAEFPLQLLKPSKVSLKSLYK